MLLRKNGLDVIAIPQPIHAWLSGQMARAWGNEHFAAPLPSDEVCLAAGSTTSAAGVARHHRA